ncbi:hypothetical protein PCE1_000169 [Barthelona sp. PCE]
MALDFENIDALKYVESEIQYNSTRVEAQFERDFELKHDEIVPHIASCLELLTKRNSHDERYEASPFDSFEPPGISIYDYFDRIFQYCNASDEALIVSYVYLYRLNAQSVPLTMYNIHRLMITAVMIAAKHTDDVFYTNRFYARVGGIDADELNRRELDFLFLLEFSLCVSENEFVKCLKHLIEVYDSFVNQK